jgi:hypothetical protein
MIYNFNTNFVFSTLAKEHSNYKQRINNLINKLSKREFKNHFSNLYDKNFFAASPILNSGKPFDVELSSIFNDLISCEFLPALEQMKKEIILPYGKSFKVNRMWLNSYNKTGTLSPHTHLNCDFSGVYLVDLNNEPNNTIFYHFTSNTAMSREYTTEQIKEGSILIFPSHLPHEALFCKEKKVTIAFDSSVVHDDAFYYGDDYGIKEFV